MKNYIELQSFERSTSKLLLGLKIGRQWTRRRPQKTSTGVKNLSVADKTSTGVKNNIEWGHHAGAKNRGTGTQQT